MILQILPIWMTSSLIGVGKESPLLLDYISKLRILKGGIFDHSPSGGCGITL